MRGRHKKRTFLYVLYGPDKERLASYLGFIRAVDPKAVEYAVDSNATLIWVLDAADSDTWAGIDTVILISDVLDERTMSLLRSYKQDRTLIVHIFGGSEEDYTPEESWRHVRKIGR